MSILKRIKFAFTHNIQPGYIVVSYGEPGRITWFSNYKDAVAFAIKENKKNLQFPIASVLVIVEKKL